MIWNRECHKTRRLLALREGHDLEECEAAGVERHLAGCPHCREIRRGLQRSQQALEVVRPAGVPGGQQLASVWPGVSRHIRSIDEISVSHGWREWLPTGALAAACVAMIAALLPPARPGDSRLAADSVRVFVGPSAGPVQRFSGGRPRMVNGQVRPVPWAPADPDSYRNF
jgi:hypothetical protein